MAKFSFIDLFAGIGGFHVAMTELGGECVFASEIDDHAAEAYAAAFPETPLHGDIRKFTDDGADPRQIPDHDVLCAGFPCQPFSKSGYQRGINETRGTLFFDILRILEAKRPQFAILENVRNLAGPRQRDTWDTIVQNLRDLGYRVADEPVVFSPHLLPPPELGGEGRPQVRERVFILCEFVGEGGDVDGDVLVDNKPIESWDSMQWRIDDWLDDEAEMAPEELERYRLREDEARWIEAWDAFVKRIGSDWLPGFPIWVDAFDDEPEVEGLPKWKQAFHRKNSAFYVEHREVINEWRHEFDVDNFPPSRRRFEWQARKWQPTQQDRDLYGLVWHFRPSGIRVKPPTYLPALVAITQTSVIGSRRPPRRITPREAARLQGFPDSHPLHPIDAKAYKQLGNAVNVGAVKHVARALFESARDRSLASAVA